MIDDDEHEEVPPVKPTAISYVDRSHSRPVVDVYWTPPDQQVCVCVCVCVYIYV
jgi:hypothetical protein